MRRIKEEIILAEISEKEIRSTECCMCGDYGLTFELFRCTVCENKSQHRYCSVQYPKSDSYDICNWCLSQKIDTVDDKVQNSNSPSFSQKMEDDQTKIKGRRGSSRGGGGDERPQTSPKGEKKKGLAAMKVKLINKKIKKSKSPPPQESPPRPPAAPKRIALSGSGDKERLRRTRSEEAIQRSNNTIMRKHMYKYKVRRYKLLDEVSC